MHTAARRSCVVDVAQEHPPHSNGHKEIPPALLRAKVQAPHHPSPEKIRVFLATGNRLLTEALARMLGRQQRLQIERAELSTAEQIEQLSLAGAGVLLLSPGGNLAADLAAIQQMRATAPALRILLLGMSADEREFLQCVRAGVSGYLLLDASGDEVARAIYAVAAGEAVCRGDLCGVLFRYFERETSALPSAAVRRNLGLTRREQQLIPLIAEGLTNKEIANRFSLSEQTVKNHIYRMKHKIGAGDRLDIAQVYRVHGLFV